MKTKKKIKSQFKNIECNASTLKEISENANRTRFKSDMVSVENTLRILAKNGARQHVYTVYSYWNQSGNFIDEFKEILEKKGFTIEKDLNGTYYRFTISW